MEKLAGIEASAISLLKRAVELDQNHRFTEALICYEQGIQLLLDVSKATTDETKKQRFHLRMTEYMNRAEKIKTHVKEEREAGTYHEQIQIEANTTGNSYEKVLGRFLDSSVTQIEVEDPYVRNIHQIYNFLRFCELAVKNCENMKTISLLTSVDEGGSGGADQQSSRLGELYNSLAERGVTLNVSFSPTLHDREIRLDNGWTIKIGRGLDYFKPPASKFSLGYCDYDLRTCHQTTVDIYHKNSQTNKKQ